MFAATLAARRITPLTRRLISPCLIQRSVAANTTDLPQYDPVASQKVFHPVHNHSTMFKLERYFSAAMVPLFPAAYFVHTPAIDMALAFAIALHVHWGLHGVLSDYGRPFVLGPALAKIVQGPIAYLLSFTLLAGLLHFNSYDVGITKAFEMVWSL